MSLMRNQVNDIDKRRRHPPPYMVKLFNDHTRCQDVDELFISSARNSYSHHQGKMKAEVEKILKLYEELEEACETANSHFFDKGRHVHL